MIAIYFFSTNVFDSMTLKYKYFKNKFFKNLQCDSNIFSSNFLINIFKLKFGKN